MNFAYLRDDFKVSQRLTVNLGLRYEFAMPQYDRDNRMSNYDPATNSLVLASSGSIASRALVNPQTHNLGPRLGLAYSLNPKTVIRSGYGISYVLFERQGSDSYLTYNGPFIVNAQITQGLAVRTRAQVRIRFVLAAGSRFRRMGSLRYQYHDRRAADQSDL